VGEEGIALRDIAEVIGAELKLPVESITPEEAPGISAGCRTWPRSMLRPPALTHQQLNWNPIGPDLLTNQRKIIAVEKRGKNANSPGMISLISVVPTH
jgi:hypothetical protein